jgi:hypothetical protein
MALWVISPSCLPQRQGVQGWPAILKARRYSQLNRNRQNITSRLPVVLASPHPIKGQARVQRRGRRRRKKNTKQKIDISSNRLFPLFSLRLGLDTLSRMLVTPTRAPRCKEIQTSPPAGRRAFFCPNQDKPRVFPLHHHPGKRHAAFTRWFRTPSGPNTDSIFILRRLGGLKSPYTKQTHKLSLSL